MHTQDAEELRRVAVKIAGEAAGYLRDIACSSERLSRVVKGETVLVDVMAEDYIIGALREELGPLRVVTEEKGVVGEGDLTAVVDPLDGSKNYLNCIPWASVSIAFVQSGGRLSDVLAGAVAPIFYGFPISFASDGGCFIGNQRVYPQEPERFIYVYIDHPEAAYTIAKIIGELGGGYKVRSLGSAALEIAYTGLGRGAAFLDLRSKLRNVDLSAAYGIVRECGGFVLNSRGEQLDLSMDRVVRAGNVVAVPNKAVYENIKNILGWKK